MILNTIILAAKIVGIDPFILLSVCMVESHHRVVNFFGDNGAPSYGICQLQLNTAREFDPSVDALALQIPIVNATIAAKYIKQQTRKYKNRWHGVAAYNAGSLRLVDGKPFNQEYVDKVNKHYCNFRRHICIYENTKRN